MIKQLAFDRESVRTFDQDGRMHVELTNISKANICEYYGREIPYGQQLGLIPTKKYRLLRSPDELALAADSFNNLPVLWRHQRVSAYEPHHELVVGSTGTDCVFQPPYLKNSMVVWDQVAVDGVESKERCEISCSYHYRADMTPGVFQGQRYDGIMRNIRGNHVALVPEGRVGSDVVVGDSKIDSLEKECSYMSKRAHLSTRAAIAWGMLMTYLQPRLAQDAKVDLLPVFDGITKENWKERKPEIAKRLKHALTGKIDGKLANDASMESLMKLLDSLEGSGTGGLNDQLGDPDDGTPAGEGDADADPGAAGPGAGAPPAAGAAPGAAPGAGGEDRGTKLVATLKEIFAKCIQLLDAHERGEEPGAAPLPAAGGEGDPTGKPAPVKPAAASAGGESGTGSPADGGVKDKRSPADGSSDNPPPTPGTPAPPAPAVSNTVPRKEDEMDKAAMDAALKDAAKVARENARAITRAEKAIRPLVGEIDTLACDSADDVYGAALKAAGIDIEGVPSGAFGKMVELAISARQGGVHREPIAVDSAAVKEFNERYPNRAKVRVLG